LPTPSITNEAIAATVAARQAHKTNVDAAKALGIDEKTVRRHMTLAAERGMLGFNPVLPGFRVSQATSTPNGDYVQQRPELGPEFVPTDGLAIKGKTTLVSGDGRIMHQHVMERFDASRQLDMMRAVVDALKEEVPRVEPTPAPGSTIGELLNLYAVTDAHFGMLSWREETGADYDLPIAEKLLLDWFAAAIDLAPPAETAIFAQIGDLLHYDGFESKTPTSGHILDADSRLPKVIRVVIRTLRRVIAMLLEKHKFVHVIMADANHDPASEAWLREMFAAFYDNEPRVTVDSSASTYYAYRHGDVSLFVHHGHRRKVGNVDTVFAGKFREMYGQTKFSYAHLGHLHSDELKSTNLMKVERHETLAAADAYAANGGWLSGRSAKVITYSKNHGEVARLTLTPGMVGGWRTAANDNEPKEMVA
jgi:hypothetical protein